MTTTLASLVRERHAELAETTLELVGHETTNPPGDTREVVAWLESQFTDFGIETERVVANPEKPNLLATVAGERDRTLLFAGHLDTVPYDADGWSYDPLGERVGDQLYGRGTSDMKGALAAMLAVARAAAESETSPPVTLSFAFVSDEEVAGEAGLPAVLKDGRLAADACVIGEPTCDDERASLTVADRGSIWLTFEATGKAAHGSRPMLGENAIDRLWRALEDVRTRLEDRTLSIPPTVEPVLEESVDYYAQAMGADTARRLFDRPTVNLGTLEGGKAVNSVPREARARLDVRLAPGVETPAVLASIRDWLETHRAVSIADVSYSVGSYEDLAEPIVDATHAVASDILEDRVYRRSATGGGDAKQFRNADVPTVEFAVATNTAHACDEYTTVDALAETAEVYARLPEAFASAV
ncbi:M20 family metallopeptidase [Natronobacterium gregoryi]|uniref:Acetylornithine deacetylase n=2 Tax=Natronobacterium gregoryi TaxID=44930 RepID=L0AMB3_NATGS|nr:M20/M25/M40 family metallo-hydrolase [Natronobacterium gregoryi]AFZ74175.1 acetylornithine deacetylase/succinyldiaminopimelate desuccinylase-like deacylase [Natronobacterium gregoryi SP2]ELY63631.1 acetylornithine deacetylase/succinyl-diaminopimelate desuccinylase [Natronobacterium gregoryi SP2]PLK22031.1 acetylornithine deacetylase [Natronobacterium gregoryi SP2]SFI50882.1 succinyl-diaminopimelate desuccinylase [Natronobacterium gregoryi]